MTMSVLERQSRIAGGLVGLLVGDALGVPYEFHDMSDIPPMEQINYNPPVGFDRAHEGILPATWSDDGAQALCLLASLLHCGKLDMTDFSNRMLNWYDAGYMAVDYQVFDVGIATGRGLRAFKNGMDPEQAGGLDPDSHGNGALMRVLPLALWHQGSDAQLMRDAGLQASITHAQPRSHMCCAIYCLMARALLQNIGNPWDYAIETVGRAFHDDDAMMAELQFYIRPYDDIEPEGSGYVVDSLRAAKKALSMSDYQQAVRYAISLGNDTDTTACIMGGLVGLRDGIEAIPQKWRHELRGQSIYQPLLEQLLHQTA